MPQETVLYCECCDYRDKVPMAVLKANRVYAITRRKNRKVHILYIKSSNTD